jgi:hypothetical protein
VRASLLALAVVASGCSTVGSVFAPRLPYEARVYLLDAEEDLMTAMARTEEAQRDVAQARRDLDSAQSRAHSLKESPLKKEAFAEVSLAKARVVRAEKSAELLVASQDCAERRYAAARAQAEVKFKVKRADPSNAARLADKADACDGKLDRKRDALAVAEEALNRARSEQDRAAIQAAAQSPAQYPRPWLE